MNKTYQIPYFVTEGNVSEHKLAIVESPTKYAATLLLYGAYSKAGNGQVSIDYDGVKEVVELNALNNWTV